MVHSLLGLPIRIKAIVPCLQILKAPFLWLVRPLLKATLVVDKTTVGGDSSGWQDHFYRQLKWLTRPLLKATLVVGKTTFESYSSG